MARKIYITEADKKEAIAKLQTQLDDKNATLTLEKKIKFELNITENEDALPPTVYLSLMAFAKMKYLVESTDNEIGWHGVMRRLDKETYIIDDIVVYPQTVSMATVTVDETKLAQWQMKQPDNIFNNLKMQGHSHVNMSTTPSAVDITTYEKFLQGLDKQNGFYLFLIINKKGECFKMLYDFAQNAIFTNEEICLQCLLSETETLDDWYHATVTENIVKNNYGDHYGIVNIKNAINNNNYTTKANAIRAKNIQTFDDYLKEQEYAYALLCEESHQIEEYYNKKYETKQKAKQKAKHKGAK